ncbi:MAG: asparagine synthase-related protein [Acidobacteriota bacterium]
MTGLCGIVGGKRPDVCGRQLEIMLSSMRDEDFHRSGTFRQEEIGLYAGWTCHPGSFADGLPVANETGDVLALVAGEIFPSPDEVSGLKKAGHAFEGSGPDYLVHSYEELGPAFVGRLNGWFHGLLFDRRKGTGYLFNDRFGMRRLFVHEEDGQMFFAAQAKAILAALPATRDFDPSGLSEYLACGCTLGARSLFKGIEVLPGGTLWTFGRRGPEKRALYFDRREWEDQPRLEPDRYAEDMRALMPPVIRAYGGRRLPLAVSLTGGIDTRLVMSCLDLRPGDTPCYTFGSMYRDTFDVSLARRIAHRCGQDHSSIVLGREFLQDFRPGLDAACLRSDGCLSLSGAAYLHVNRLARRIAPIRLTGNFGSELLRGVRTFKSQKPKVPFYDPAIAPHLEAARRTFEGLAAVDPISFSLFFQAPNLGYGLLSVEESQLVMRTPFLDNELAKLAYRGPRSYAAGLDLSVAVIRDNRPELLDIPTDFGYLGRGGRLVRSVRKAHHQALFRGEYLASHGMPRSVALLIKLAPWLSPEKLLLGRHKYHHFRTWVRRELAVDIRDVLLAGPDFPSCLDRRSVEGMLEAHLAGRDNFLDEIEKALTVVLDHRLLFHPAADRPGADPC